MTFHLELNNYLNPLYPIIYMYMMYIDTYTRGNYQECIVLKEFDTQQNRLCIPNGIIFLIHVVLISINKKLVSVGENACIVLNYDIHWTFLIEHIFLMSEWNLEKESPGIWIFVKFYLCKFVIVSHVQLNCHSYFYNKFGFQGGSSRWRFVWWFRKQEKAGNALKETIVQVEQFHVFVC